MLRSRGRRLLFADADGATRFADIDKLEGEMVKLTANSEASEPLIAIQMRRIRMRLKLID